MVSCQSINSSPLSAVFMCQWIGSTLVLCWVIVNWTLRNKLLQNFYENTKLFINENASENICEMANILSRGRWVNLKTWPVSQVHAFIHTLWHHFTIQKLQLSNSIEKKRRKWRQLLLITWHVAPGWQLWIKCTCHQITFVLLFSRALDELPMHIYNKQSNYTYLYK